LIIFEQIKPKKCDLRLQREYTNIDLKSLNGLPCSVRIDIIIYLYVFQSQYILIHQMVLDYVNGKLEVEVVPIYENLRSDSYAL